LYSESGADVQRIDLLGQTNSNEIILGMKVTTTDDYIGQFVRTATLSLDDLQLTDFDDARGPFTTTKFGQPVVFCVADSRLCKNGELFLKGTGTNSVFSLDPGFGLPFLSFPTRINLP
jgi:hypothetical protein